MSGTIPPGPVVFDYGLWEATYPELVPSVTLQQATAYFVQAQLYLDNTACSPVTDNSPGGMRAILLNMLVAHIAKLFATINGQEPSTLVGRITNASEGSVSVAVNMPGASPSSAWFMQTQYGAAFWQATASFRLMKYMPGPRPYLGVGGFGRGAGFFGGNGRSF
jgi:hypothetical protein